MIARWLRERSERRAALRDLEESQRLDEAALAATEPNPVALAKMALDSGDLPGAEALWEKARVLLPRESAIPRDSYTILLALKRYDEAETLLKARRGRLPRDGFNEIVWAAIAEERGDLTEAARRWKIARQKTRDLEACLREAHALQRLGRHARADAILRQAVREFPEQQEPLNALACYSEEQKDWPAALARWTAAAEAFNLAPAICGRARALLELGRVEEADAYIGGLLPNHVRDTDILITYAHIAEHRRDPVLAVERWAAMRHHAPRASAGYREGARCLAVTGRHPEADAVSREAMEVFPAENWPWLDHAHLAHRRGEWVEAASRWALLRQRDPGDADGWTRGAEALRGDGRAAEAEALGAPPDRGTPLPG